MMDVTASGGYYIACACDQIVAYPTTITGSIGVIVQTLSLQPALGNLGITAEAITSGPNKNVGSPLSQMTDKQRAIIQQLVDDFYARFIAVVRKARPNIPADQFKHATDGRVVTGDQALKWQLVDRVGDLYDAVDAASTLAGIRSADLIMYRRPLAYVGSAFAQSPVATHMTQINLAQVNLGNLSPLAPGFSDAGVGIFYLWRMGSP
jgi:protease-4